MAGYDETDFPMGNFARQLAGSSRNSGTRTRDLERLDAAAKNRLVPRMSKVEAGVSGLQDWNNRQDSAIAAARSTASDGVNRANNAAGAASRAQATANTANSTANNAYNRTTDLYERLRLLTLRVEKLEKR